MKRQGQLAVLMVKLEEPGPAGWRRGVETTERLEIKIQGAEIVRGSRCRVTETSSQLLRQDWSLH